LDRIVSKTPARGAGRATKSGIPLRIFQRLPLPVSLAEAIGATMDAQMRVVDADARAMLASRTQRALEAWLDGTSTMSQAVQALEGARSNALADEKAS
jgi:hypothetical protein